MRYKKIASFTQCFYINSSALRDKKVSRNTTRASTVEGKKIISNNFTLWMMNSNLSATITHERNLRQALFYLFNSGCRSNANAFLNNVVYGERGKEHFAFHFRYYYMVYGFDSVRKIFL